MRRAIWLPWTPWTRGFRETVLVVSGSSARMPAECKDRPVDAAIIGIVDIVNLDSQHEAELAAVRRK